MKGEESGNVLLTDEERRVQLQKLYGHRLTKPGKLHLPTAATYDSLTTDEGLHKLFTEFCRWLGFKPEKVQVYFSTHTTSYASDNSQIVIGQAYQRHPYAAGALLALATLDHFIERYSHAVPDRVTLEFASLESGLSLWVLNGLRPKLSWAQSIYHVLDASWVHREGIRLENYNPAQYAHEIADYAQRNRLPTEEYITHVSKQRRHLLPKHVSLSILPALPEPTIALQHQKAARQLWLKLLLIVSIVTAVICLGIYLWAGRHPAVSARQLEDQKALEVMKSSYDACAEKATQEQNTYDPNDLFLNRQIEATKGRCESLRNEYNYALDQYQKIYK